MREIERRRKGEQRNKERERERESNREKERKEREKERERAREIELIRCVVRFCAPSIHPSLQIRQRQTAQLFRTAPLQSVGNRCDRGESGMG